MSIEFSTITIICFVSQPNRNDIMYMRYVREERLVCYFRSPLLHSYYRTLQRVVNYQVQRRKWSTSVKFRRRLLGTNNFRCDINIFISELILLGWRGVYFRIMSFYYPTNHMEMLNRKSLELFIQYLNGIALT